MQLKQRALGGVLYASLTMERLKYMRQYQLLAVILAGLWACAHPPSGASSAQRVSLGVVLHGAEARRLLEPCTRPGPEGVDSLWVPTAEDVAAFERALGRDWATQRPEFQGVELVRPLREYRGQYAGIYRGAGRLIYGSFIVRSLIHAPEQFDYSRQALHWCDGGGQMFGAVYDPVTDVLSEMITNESAVVESAGDLRLPTPPPGQ